MEKEMNFIDLCVACWRALGRLCVACWQIFARMLRLTYRYWYIVLTVVALAVAAAIYHTRPDNIRYRVYATALVNGASMTQFEEAFAPLKSGMLMPESDIAWYMYHKQAQRYNLYRVIDAKRDGTPDYIDFKGKSNPKDTVLVQMQDRICITFDVPGFVLPSVPEMERATMEMLNSNEQLQVAYEAYVANLREEVAFNHRQAVKLDSLTSCYYYQMQPQIQTGNNSSITLSGEKRVRLFLNDIYKQQLHTQLYDYKLQMATAPVVLENHFAILKAVDSRMKWTLVLLILGWAAGCLLAEIIDQRKAIFAWLKQ